MTLKLYLNFIIHTHNVQIYAEKRGTRLHFAKRSAHNVIHVTIIASSIWLSSVLDRFPFKNDFMDGKRWKPEGAKSGE